MKNTKKVTQKEPKGFVFVVCLRDVKRDFPATERFAKLCDLPDFFNYTTNRQGLLDIVAKAKLTANIHVLSPGKIHEKWFAPIGTNSFTVPDAKLDGSWNVIVETIQGGVAPGWLLTGCGHYIEQLASGNGYKAGKYELRGTSFDHAVALASLVSGVDSENRELRQTADCLVAILNGTWLSRHCGIDPVYSAVQLVTMVVGDTENEDKVGAALLEKFADVLAKSIMQGNFYEKHVEQIGWATEKGMCLVMDAATAFLLRTITDSLKPTKS